MRGPEASFLLRRMGSALLLPVSLVLAIATSVGTTTALAGFGGRGLPAAAAQRLAALPDAAVHISGQIGAATASSDTQVIESSLRSALGGVPFTLSTGRWSDQLTLPQQPHTGTVVPQLQAAVLTGVTTHVKLAAGSWPGPADPGQPIGAVLPVSTARLLRLSVGSVLALHDSTTGAPARLRVTGLFAVRDPAAPYWRLSLLGTSGKLVQGNFVTYGPVLVNPAALAGPGGLTVGEASWLAGIDAVKIPPDRLGAVSKRLAGAVSFLGSAQRLGGLQAASSLPPSLGALASSLVVTRSLLLIGSLELILLALAAVTLASWLLASQREGETALLSARGLARSQLAVAALAEAALLAVVGAAAGTLLGMQVADQLLSANGLLSGRLAGAGQRVSIADVWWPAAVIAVLAILIMAWPVLRPVPPGDARARKGRQAALSGVAKAGLDVGLIALAVLAFWELRRYSAAQQIVGGGLGIDPVLAAAPVVALAGVTLIALRLLPVAARLLDRASARGKHLHRALAAWQVSRRPQRQGGPVLLVVLTVATGTLALAQHQSWRQSQLDQAAFTAGADVRVDLASPLPLAGSGRIAAARGVVSATPVSAFNDGFNVFAVDARTAAATVLLRPDLSALPPAALWKRITPSHASPGLTLPGRPTGLSLTAMLRPLDGQRLAAASVSLSVQDGSGIVYQIPAGDLPADGRDHRLTVSLSGRREARYPLRLLALSASYQLPGFPPAPHPGQARIPPPTRAERRAAAARATLVISGLTDGVRAGGALTLASLYPTVSAAGLAGPHARGIGPALASWRHTAGAATLTFSAGAGQLIQKPGLPPLPVTGQLTLTAAQPTLPLPAIVTTAFLGSASAHLGQVVPLPVGDASVPVRLVAAVRAFPTTAAGQPAVILDLASLQTVLALQSQPPVPVTQWWLRAGPGGPAGLPPGAAIISRAGTAAALLNDPLPNVEQLGLLVIVAAAALLACVGLAVSVVAAVRERRMTDALLAALGVRPAARARQLCLEQLMLSLPAAAAGLLIGIVLARLLLPAVTLTGRAGAPFPPAVLVIPLGSLALLGLAVVAVPVAVSAATAAYQPDLAAELRAGESP
ncbi:MAG TPA: FtsX-like permease family protein [Streptosporangiaceae bacterium]|nr:FtsX-like permease family protein [Streptosporangiaceae bacterium]